MNLFSFSMKIVESKLLAGVSDVVDSAGKGNSFAGKFLSWSDLALHAIYINVCGDREGWVELVGIWFRILGLPKLLDVSRPEFIVLLCSHTYRVSMVLNMPDRVTLPLGSEPLHRLERWRRCWHPVVAVRWQRP